MTEGNVLYYGDNLDVLRRHVPDQSVDLVYLDPPFNSDADYNVLFAEHGEKAAAQVRAFEDTWEWNADSRAAYEEVVEAGGSLADTMRAFRTMLGGTDMLAYLSMMAPRLSELKRVLKPTGTVYLHCDPTASAHLRLLMDAIFGAGAWLNEIIWHYQTSSGSPKKWLHRNHDVILRYAAVRPELVKWHHPRLPWPETTLRKWQTDEEGRIYRVQNKFNKRYYIDPAGKLDDDVWDITLSSRTSERLGYPTQKPEALLEKIVLASSDEGDVVLDPFCGCGTATVVAHRFKRRWIGIDITHLSVGLIKHRLADQFGPEVASSYRVVGEPTTVDDAAVLAREDPWQFQAWALGLVGARIASSDKRGGDKGIDGRLYFHDSASGPTRQVVLSVKAGHVVPTFVDALWGVVEREKAEIGVLISFVEPTAGMRARAAEAGFYESPWGKHPRIQLRTVRELLDGKGIDYPHVTGANVTLRRANRARPVAPESLEMFERAAEEPEPYGSN